MALHIKEDAPYADFARRLLALRKEAKLTREQLAEKCGISSRTIVNYENGSRIPFADTAVKMAEAFGLSVEDLLGVKNPALEQEKAEALESIRRIYGTSGMKQARHLLDGTGSLLAGGTLTAEQQSDFILEMQKLFIIATENARQKYTPKKYRTKEKEEASKVRMREVGRIDNIIEERAKNAKQDAYLDDDEFWE